MPCEVRVRVPSRWYDNGAVYRLGTAYNYGIGKPRYPVPAPLELSTDLFTEQWIHGLQTNSHWIKYIYWKMEKEGYY